jgi:DNA-binding MarR family transcriptional regulator
MSGESNRDDLHQQAIDRFWETVPPVWNQVRNHLRCIVSEKFDISVEQFHILRHIRKGITLTSELASVKQISRPAISQGVDSLVEKGLIHRQQDPDDRRFVRLELTKEGNELLNQIFRENSGWMLEKMGHLTPDQLSCLIDSLEWLKESFTAPSAQ